MRLRKITSSLFYLNFLLLAVVFCGCDDLDYGYVVDSRQNPVVDYRHNQPPDGLLRVYFFDVGQGDATLLAGPDFTILVDAGRHDRNDVVHHLRSVGVVGIDLLIGTHPHADHIGQFPQVIANFPVREVWMSGDQHNSRTFERAIDAVIESDAGYHEPRAGEVLQIGSARVEILNPTRLTGDLHEGCIGIRVVYGDIAFMLPGDIEEPVERRMIEMGLPLRSQILKLGHHGSRTSTSRDFLFQVQPAVAFYSAGAGNSFGHPHQSVLNLLNRYDIPVYGTDRSGTIEVVTDGYRFEINPSQPGGAVAQRTNNYTINLNTASPRELLEIPHMTPQRIEQLMQLRPIRSWEELTQINGLGPVRVGEIQQQGRARLEY